MPQKSPPAAKQQLDAFFADLERELDKVEFFRPDEKRGIMSVNLRNIFQRMAPTQQDIRTLHGVVTAITQGRKGPARGGVLDGAGAQKLRDLLAEHGAGRAPSERTPLRGLPRLLRRNPTDAERALWQALVNDRRFAGRGFKRQVPIGPHIVDFVSFPLKCVIDLVPAAEDEAAAGLRADQRAWLRGARLPGGRGEGGGCRSRTWPQVLDRTRRRACQPFSAFTCAATPSRKIAEIAADGDEAETAFGHGQRALGVVAVDAGNFAGFFRRRADLVDGALDFRRLHVLRLAAGERGRQIVGADEQRIDAGRRGDRLDIGKRRRRLDHRQRERAVIGLAQVVDRRGLALQRHGALRAPAALAERRIFGDARRIGGHRRRC